MSKKYPKRGEIWIINLGENLGSEQNGIRPAVVINHPVKRERTCLVVPASSCVRPYSCTVENYKFLIHQTRAIDTSRLLRRIERLKQENTDKVKIAIVDFIQ